MFALQLLLHCNYVCIAIIFALQLFLHYNYVCMQLRTHICALQILLRYTYFCIAIIFACNCNYFCMHLFAWQLLLHAIAIICTSCAWPSIRAVAMADAAAGKGRAKKSQGASAPIGSCR